jgi:hypothetical protein
MMSLFVLLPVGFEPTGPYATTIVSQADVGTCHTKVIVVPDFVPRTVTFPRTELLMTTSAWFAPARFASVTFRIVPVIVSPTRTFHFVRFSASPVCAIPPVGRSRLPGPIPAIADGANASEPSRSAAETSADAPARGMPCAQRSALSPSPLIAANPPLCSPAPNRPCISP